MDPYQILGVSRSASGDEIRKAYRGLAKKFHPDKNPGDEVIAEKFKKITAAYNLLTNPELKARYDRGELDGQGNQKAPFGGGGPFPGGGVGGMGGADIQDIFEQLFGGGPFGGGARQQRSMARKGADMRYKMTIGFMDAVLGATRTIQMADGQALKVRIPEGVESGKTLRLRGKGEAGFGGGPAGDALVDITVAGHPVYKRDGHTLRMDLPLTLDEAIKGATIRVETPHGKVGLKIPPQTSSGKRFRLKGKGIKGGDLFITAMIMLPESDDAALQGFAEEWSGDYPGDFRNQV